MKKRIPFRLKLLFSFLLINSTFCFQGILIANETLDSLRKVAAVDTKDGARANFQLAKYFYKRTYGYSPNEDSSTFYIHQARRKAKKLDFDSLIAQCYFYNGKTLNRLGLYEQAIDSLLIAKNIFKNIGDSTYISKAQVLLAYNYEDLGLYEAAIQNLEEATKRSHKSKDTILQATINLALGGIFSATEHYKQSRKYVRRAIAIYKSLPTDRSIEIGGAYMNIGRSYTFEANYDSGYYNYEQALLHFRKANFKRGIGIVFNNLGDYFRSLEDYDRSTDYFSKSVAIFKEIEDQKKLMDTYLYLGENYRILGKFDKARAYLSKAEALPIETGNSNFNLNLERLRAMLYEQEGNFKKALYHFKKLAAKNDSLNKYTAAERIKITDRKIEYLRKQEKEKVRQSQLAAYQKEEELNSTKQQAILTIGLLLCLLVILSFVFVIKKRRLEFAVLEKQLKEKEKTNLALEKEVQIKRKKLSSYALQLIDKNKKMDTLKESLSSLKEKVQDNASLINQLSVLEKEINLVKNSEQNWEEFKLYFEEVYVDFFSKIKELHPTISAKELRLSALLRLNLSTKEIANLLNLPSKTIEVARYRLRKKLRLQPQQKLVEYIMSIQ